MKNTKTYHELVQKMRTFFLNKGFLEVPTQSRLSILAACENPHSITTFEYQGQIWPLPQTGQMWLEYELLQNPEWPGVFCISTSYRQEKDPIPGRHELIFPMFEFESKGGM
jgi:aspartyl/asparaginyl-tRNA synthetase